MSRVSRREDEFYSMFSEFSALIVSTAKLFVSYMESFPSSEDYEVQIKNYETLCDDQVGKIISTLNTSFITPFDREDISRLALLMDEIADGIESVSAHLSMYDIKEMRPEAVQVAHLILFASEELQKLLTVFLITIKMTRLLGIRALQMNTRIRAMSSTATL